MTKRNEALLGLATTRELLVELEVRMRVTQNSTAGRELGMLCAQALENLHDGVLNYRTADPEVVVINLDQMWEDSKIIGRAVALMADRIIRVGFPAEHKTSLIRWLVWVAHTGKHPDESAVKRAEEAERAKP